MKKLSILSQLDNTLRVLKTRKAYKAEFNKTFITKIHNGFFIRFFNFPAELKTLRVYLNILLSDGTKCIKACLLDENIHNRYVQIDKFKKGEEILLAISLKAEQQVDKEFEFVLEEA